MSTPTTRSNTTGNRVIIVGAGLVGCLTALVLQQKGFSVTLYERYKDFRSIPSLGRSINLSLTGRGLRAISQAGHDVLAEVIDMGSPVTGRILHNTYTSDRLFQRYGKDDTEFNLSISRFELNKYLIQKATDKGAAVVFDYNLESLDASGEWLTLIFQTPNGKVTVDAGCPVIAADGGGSRVRYQLRDAGLTTFTEEQCIQGYKEIMFPKYEALPVEHQNATLPLEPYGLHIWPRGTHFLMALANTDGSFTGTIYCDTSGDESSFAALNSKQKVRDFFNEHYSDAIPLLGGHDAIAKQMLENPEGFLGTVRTTNIAVGAKVCLIGDAAHAITPFFGQGTNAGFEDVGILNELLEKFSDRPMKLQFGMAFSAYAFEQPPNNNAIGSMALENFVEMRDTVGDPNFLLMKEVQNMLENKFEDVFRSRYAMVCYGGGGNISYSAAYAVGEIQREVLLELCKHISSVEEVDMQHARDLINQKIVPALEQWKIDLSQIIHGVAGLDARKNAQSRL